MEREEEGVGGEVVAAGRQARARRRRAADREEEEEGEGEPMLVDVAAAGGGGGAAAFGGRGGAARPRDAAVAAAARSPPSPPPAPPPSASLEEAVERGRGFEYIGYQEVVEEFRASRELFSEKYSFEDIRAVEVSPEADLEDAIATHAKIKLQPGREYRLSSPLTIRACCYVLGQGATIRVTTSAQPAIRVSALQVGPSITGMWGVTFVNCRFERAPELRGVLIRAATHVLFHGCAFSGITGTCLELGAGGYVRGCEFTSCYRGVASVSSRDVKVRQCYFDKCLLGVTAAGDFRLSGNLSVETYCFAHVEGEGLIKGNTVKSPTRWTGVSGFSLVTCADGQVTALGSLHVVAHRGRRWPTLQGNVFVRAKLYLGNRLGVLSLPQCAFFRSSICVDARAANKLVLACAFENGVTVYKVLRQEHRPTVKMCVCGSSHYANPLVFGIISAEINSSRYSFTVDSAEYSSDDE